MFILEHKKQMKTLKEPPINNSEFCLDNLLWFLRAQTPVDLERFLKKHDFVNKIITLMREECEGYMDKEVVILMKYLSV